MALTFTEMEAITDSYYMADNRKAVDIYFNNSFFNDYFMNKKKGIFERPSGGINIKIPLEYDYGTGGTFVRAGTVSSDDKAVLNAALFTWKHYYGSATIYKTDELENSGEYAEVQLVTSKLANAQKTIAWYLANDIYTGNGDNAAGLTGLLNLTDATNTTVAYGNIAQADLVASDGSYPWRANRTTTTEGISLAVIRTLRTSAKIYDGPNGKPDVGLTTEALFNIVSGILQTQQRFTQDTETANAGFQNIVFEGMIIAADDYCPSGDFFALNSKFIGYAIHRDGYFVRSPWADLITANLVAKSMKIFWHGNLVCNNRRAHALHTNLS